MPEGAHGRDDMGVGVSAISQRQVMASQRKSKATTHASTSQRTGHAVAIGFRPPRRWLVFAPGHHPVKPNPMPESTRDRCTKAHEYLFLLSKSRRYHYDSDAIREPANLTGKGSANGFRGGAYLNGATFDNAEGGKRTSTGNTVPPNNGGGWVMAWTQRPATGQELRYQPAGIPQPATVATALFTRRRALQA